MTTVNGAGNTPEPKITEKLVKPKGSGKDVAWKKLPIDMTSDDSSFTEANYLARITKARGYNLVDTDQNKRLNTEQEKFLIANQMNKTAVKVGDDVTFKYTNQGDKADNEVSKYELSNMLDYREQLSGKKESELTAKEKEFIKGFDSTFTKNSGIGTHSFEADVVFKDWGVLSKLVRNTDFHRHDHHTSHLTIDVNNNGRYEEGIDKSYDGEDAMIMQRDLAKGGFVLEHNGTLDYKYSMKEKSGNLETFKGIEDYAKSVKEFRAERREYLDKNVEADKQIVRLPDVHPDLDNILNPNMKVRESYLNWAESQGLDLSEHIHVDE